METASSATEETFLTASEVAARWQVHKATVLRLYHERKLKGMKVNLGTARSLIRFRLSTIQAYEERNGAR